MSKAKTAKPLGDTAKDLGLGKPKASKKKAAPKKVSAKTAERLANKKIESKLKGKTIVGKAGLILLKPANVVVVDGFNPRIDKGDIPALMKSIKRNGVTTPIKVRKVAKHFELVDGERRLIAALKLGLPSIPAQVIKAGIITHAELLNLALVSNDGKPLAPVEQAEAFRRLVNDGWSARAIAVATGHSLRLVGDRLTLISAHPDVAKAVKSGKLSLSMGLAIAKKAKHKGRKQKGLVKKATGSKKGAMKVASKLGKASLKVKFDKANVALRNRLNKLVTMINKKLKKGEKKVPRNLASQITFFSKHSNRLVRAAFVAGGTCAITEVLGKASAKKTTSKRLTARAKSSKGRNK